MTRAHRSTTSAAAGALLALTSHVSAETPAEIADAEATLRHRTWPVSAELGAIYMDSRYQYYHGDVRTLGPGVGAVFSAGRAVDRRLAFGVSAQGAVSIQPYVLVDGYQASVQENSFWLGSVGPFIDYRQLTGGLRLLGTAGLAATHMDVPATDVGAALGFGVGVGIGWDFAMQSPVQLSLLGRATGTQTWDDGTRISGLTAGFYLAVEPRGERTAVASR